MLTKVVIAHLKFKGKRIDPFPLHTHGTPRRSGNTGISSC